MAKYKTIRSVSVQALSLWRVTTPVEKVAIRREIGGPISEVPVIPAYNVVIQAVDGIAAAETAFKHLESLGMPSARISVSLLHEVVPGVFDGVGPPATYVSSSIMAEPGDIHVSGGYLGRGHKKKGR
jgi:hypothetical protein